MGYESPKTEERNRERGRRRQRNVDFKNVRKNNKKYLNENRK
jgi:hypothetical protein